MYNNFSSKKTKKVISALLASALVVTSAPITANAATAKVVGIGKTFTIKKTTKVSGLSKAEKKIVKVTVNKKKRTVTVKGLKAGKATFKIGKKAYTVMVGATSITKKTVTTNMTAGETKTLSVNAVNGKGDTIQFTSSKKGVVKVNKASAKANAKNVASTTVTAVAAGTAKITAKSKFTGKSKTFTIKVEAAAPAATTAPAGTDAPEATTGTATTAPATSQDPAKTEDPNTTKAPNATDAPETVTGGTITVTGVVTGASVKVVSGTTVVAETTATNTTATLPNVAGGTYTLVVSAKGYNDATQLVTVNGDVAVNVTLAAKTISVKEFSAKDTQDRPVELTAVTENGTLIVEFNDEMNKETINSASFKITDASNTPIGISSRSITLSKDKKKAFVSLKGASLDKKATYTLTIEGAMSLDGVAVAKYVSSFTIANKAVISNVAADTTGSPVAMPAADKSLLATKNTDDAAPVSLYVQFSDAIDASTANASNITLTDVSKGERKAIKKISFDTTGKIAFISVDALTQDKTYTLALSGLKSSTGIDAEDYSITFAVKGAVPADTAPTVNTLDNITLTTVDGDKAWPKLTAGTHEYADTVGHTMKSSYYAGLQLRVQFSEKLTTESATEYVKLIDAATEKVVPAKVSYDEAAKVVSIVPEQDLAEDTEYKVVAYGGLKTVQGVYLNSSKQDEIIKELADFITLGVTNPTVVSVTSQDDMNSMKIDEDHVFTVTFSKPIPTLTYAKDVLIVESSATVDNYLNATYLYNSGGESVIMAAVPGTNNKSWTIKVKAATTPLARDKAYKLIFSGQDLLEDTALKADEIVRDGSSNVLKKSYVTVFSTEATDTTGPVVKNVYTGEKIAEENLVKTEQKNIVKGDKFTFEFNEKLTGTAASSALSSSNIILEKYAPTTNTWAEATAADGRIESAVYTADSLRNVKAVTVELGSSADQMEDGRYRIVFKENSVTDKAPTPNGLEKKYTFEFVGSDKKDASAVQAGTIANLTASTPNFTSETTGNVSTNANFVISFEENEIVNVTASNVEVKDEAGNVVAGKLIEKTTDTSTYSGKVYIFTPSEKLKNATVYTVTIDGITDVEGNVIPKNVTQYKTVAADVVVTDISIADKATSVDRQKTITIKLSDAVDDLNDSQNLTAAGKKNVAVKLATAADTAANILGTTGTAKLSSDKKSVTIEFTGVDADILTANTAYVLTVETQKYVADTTNAYVTVDDSKKTVNFTTGVAATDDVKPSISAITIAGQSTFDDNKIGIGGSGTTSIAITFGEKVKKDNAKVTITNVADTTKSVTVLPGATLDGTGKIVTFATSKWEAGTYKVEISGITDEAGNAMDAVTYYITTSATGA